MSEDLRDRLAILSLVEGEGFTGSGRCVLAFSDFDYISPFELLGKEKGDVREHYEANYSGNPIATKLMNDYEEMFWPELSEFAEAARLHLGSAERVDFGPHILGYFFRAGYVETDEPSAVASKMGFPGTAISIGNTSGLSNPESVLGGLAKDFLFVPDEEIGQGSYVVMSPDERVSVLEFLVRNASNPLFGEMQIEEAGKIFRGARPLELIEDLIYRSSRNEIRNLDGYLDQINQELSSI